MVERVNELHPQLNFHRFIDADVFAQTEVDGGTAVIAHRLREPGAMRQLLTEIDPDLGLVVDPEGATHAPQAAMFWGLQLPVVAVGSGATAARIASLGGGISARDPQPIATRLQAIAANPDLMRRLRAEEHEGQGQRPGEAAPHRRKATCRAGG